MERVVSDVAEFVRLGIPIVDVRAPIEFAKGHIPGAINIPLLDNEDRHHVGLCYRQNGHHAAVQLGLERVGPKMANLAQRGRDIAENGQLAVYCQRGGKRSQSMSWLWSQLGLQVHRLDGGYKSFRSWTTALLQQPREYLVLAGGTGVGKTELLHELSDLGEPVVDLEGFAHHKGSAFGAIGESPAPSQGHFENLLAMELFRIGEGAPIWIEAESRRIGTCQIPDGLWLNMQEAMRIYIELDSDQRIERLCRDYQAATKAELIRALNAIRKRLGPEAYQNALKDLDEDNRAGVVAKVLFYYDRLYDKHKDHHKARILATINVSNMQKSEIISHLKSVKDEKYL